MSSLEFAVFAASLLIVAVAAGWYLYTTFVATKQQIGVLAVQEARVYEDGSFELRVVPQVVGRVKIVGVEVASAAATFDKQEITGPDIIKDKVDVKLTPGQAVLGRVILDNGAATLFAATVQPKQA